MNQLKFLAIAGLLAASSTVVMAQDQPPAGQRPGGGRGNQMAMLMQGITLTAEQQTKVDELTKKYADMRTALRADQTLDQDARMAKQREMMTKQSDEVKVILTDEQKKVFEKNQADMAARMPPRPPTA